MTNERKSLEIRAWLHLASLRTCSAVWELRPVCVLKCRHRNCITVWSYPKLAEIKCCVRCSYYLKSGDFKVPQTEPQPFTPRPSLCSRNTLDFHSLWLWKPFLTSNLSPIMNKFDRTVDRGRPSRWESLTASCKCWCFPSACSPSTHSGIGLSCFLCFHTHTPPYATKRDSTQGQHSTYNCSNHVRPCENHFVFSKKKNTNPQNPNSVAGVHRSIGHSAAVSWE